ncbi:hypothetical protein HDU98_006381 [Podochytrium sp. JEL0797]|nr:hypothetical protein HDU98_006381 [Podochytrium sp. JEL0797]
MEDADEWDPTQVPPNGLAMLEALEALVDEGILHQQEGMREDMPIEVRRVRFTRTVKAISQIVDRKLCRIRAASLEKYFKTRWLMRRAQSYRFVMCGAVFRTLAECNLSDTELPHRERLCRTLKKCSMFKGPVSLRCVWLAALQLVREEGAPEVTSAMIVSIDDTFPHLSPSQIPLSPENLKLACTAWKNSQRRPSKSKSSISCGASKRSTSVRATTTRDASVLEKNPAAASPFDFSSSCPSALGSFSNAPHLVAEPMILEQGSSVPFLSPPTLENLTSSGSSYTTMPSIETEMDSDTLLQDLLFEKIKPPTVPNRATTGLALLFEQQQQQQQQPPSTQNDLLDHIFAPPTFLAPSVMSSLPNQMPFAVSWPQFSCPNQDMLSPESGYDFLGFAGSLDSASFLGLDGFTGADPGGFSHQHNLFCDTETASLFSNSFAFTTVGNESSPTLTMGTASATADPSPRSTVDPGADLDDAWMIDLVDAKK